MQQTPLYLTSLRLATLALKPYPTHAQTVPKFAFNPKMTFTQKRLRASPRATLSRLTAVSYRATISTIQ